MSLTSNEVRDALVEVMVTLNSLSQREWGGHPALDQASDQVQQVLDHEWPDWASADRSHD